ncbi:hypothetical protein EX30DRAFT_247054 [Ascodesmis nigricans]|uniref:Uncharacterized protein n=1 Tax=Ascodesmis nigricans TaxID=341454 RepID=A0A4V3SHJ3_9PEZI|nr:hypothetical protein EX30DRAFT_247054 [Ascodesmis nigricans]
MISDEGRLNQRFACGENGFVRLSPGIDMSIKIFSSIPSITSPPELNKPNPRPVTRINTHSTCSWHSGIIISHPFPSYSSTQHRSIPSSPTSTPISFSLILTLTPSPPQLPPTPTSPHHQPTSNTP